MRFTEYRNVLRKVRLREYRKAVRNLYVNFPFKIYMLIYMFFFGGEIEAVDGFHNTSCYSHLLITKPGFTIFCNLLVQFGTKKVLQCYVVICYSLYY